MASCGSMPTVLIVHHTPSPGLDTLMRSAVEGASNDQLDGIDVEVRPALGATASDVLAADGYVLGTPANLGYMSGALKHFFDTVYYPCLDATRGRPYGLYVHGNNDVDGAIASVEKVVTGLAWKAVAEPVRVIGDTSTAATDACWELGATVAAHVALEGPPS